MSHILVAREDNCLKCAKKIRTHICQFSNNRIQTVVISFGLAKNKFRGHQDQCISFAKKGQCI
jgi:hypothetical protein